MSIDTRVIRSEPHTEIGTIIERSAGLLVERWCNRALTEHPTAKRVHHEALRDDLMIFLEAMGRSLRQAGNHEPDQNSQCASEHGEQRWDNGWSLSEVVRDYQILQLVILEYLEQTLHRSLRYREVMAVGVFIDDAVSASIVAYVANRESDIRRMERETSDALREVNRRKDEFMAVLAHEMRNPLAPIQNSTKILQLLLNDHEPLVLNSLEIIERQTKLLACLAEDLLDLTRIEQGRLELRKQQLNLSTVFEQAVPMAEPLLKARDHRFTVTLPTESQYLDADPGRLTQIIVNLLNNAAKYTEKGGQISLTSERAGDMAVIRVRDSGLGIPPEMLSRIFDMFTQLEGTQEFRDGGLGIGLTLVRRLVELHGGSIAAFSEGLGQGSEFVVRLPLKTEPMEAAALAPQHESQLPALCHLLIIEDNDDARDALMLLLKILGHHVDAAANALRGIETAIATRPQVILIDIGLPDFNGYEVAKQVRAALGDQPFLIALTGYCQADDLRRAFDAGFDAHLTKPADVAELGRLLIRASKRGHHA